MDVKDIRLVVQWRLTCDPTTLWQRLGRAGRDRRTDVKTTGVFLVEKEHFDDEKVKRAERAKKNTSKRKYAKGPGSLTLSPNKRQKIAHSTADKTTSANHPGSSTIDIHVDTLGSDHESESSDDEFKMLQMKYSETRDSNKSTKKRKAEVHPVMEDLVNATHRSLTCRRTPINAFLENNKAGEWFPRGDVRPTLTYMYVESTYRDCDPSQPQGCDRCRPLIPTLCCDIHNPSSFDEFFVPAAKVSRLPAKSRIPTSKMTPEDCALWIALDEWREKTTITLYGHALLQDIGSSLTMPTDILNRIVDCARVFKMKTLDDLRKETKWDGADRWGSDVISIVERLRPQQPPALTTDPAPLSTSTTMNTPATRKSRTQTVCGTCGVPGHNGNTTSYSPVPYY